MYDLIIIGAGPAGLSACVYSSRQKVKTLLITKDYGGQIGRKAVSIENYLGFSNISSTELIKKFRDHLAPMESIETVIDEVIQLDKKGGVFLISTKNKKNFEAEAVIIASGADPRLLEVPGEKKFLGRGVSYCAVCDGAMFADKTVVVVGGGNSGFETAIFLNNYVKKIYLLEYGLKVKADEENQTLVKKLGKTEIITQAVVKKIEGDKFVKSLTYQDLNPVRDSKGEKKMQNKQISNGAKTKKMKKLAVEGVFVEVGNQPATSFVKGLVDFNKRDEIIVEFETCQTKTPGLFAAGDVNIGKYKQIISAAGEGAKSALAAYDYIQRKRLKK